MRLFYPRHIKSLAYYDKFSPLPFVLRQKGKKGSLYFPCSVSVTVLFANLAATSLDRHQSIRRSSEKTKFILNDYQSDYRERLSKLITLPLMMLFEINDIVFFIKCIKKPSEYLDISKLCIFLFSPYSVFLSLQVNAFTL